MKNSKNIFTLVGIISLGALAMGARDSVNSDKALNATRACVPRIGAVAITMAATTGTDADSGALNMVSTYIMRCDTDAWVRFGAAAVTAVADDWRINAGEVYYIATGGSESMAHISALSVSANGDCRLIECR